jgi:hypothetical protein
MTNDPRPTVAPSRPTIVLIADDAGDDLPFAIRVRRALKIRALRPARLVRRPSEVSSRS